MFCLFVVIVILQHSIAVGKANETIATTEQSRLQIFDDEESIVSVVVNVQENITSQFSSNAINVHVVDKSIAEIISVEDDIITSTTNSFSAHKFGLRIVGNKIGKTVVVFNFTHSSNSSLDLVISNGLTVVRRQTIFDNILSYLLGVLVVINNFGFGCNFDYTIGKELVKTPKPVLIGIACQFVTLPLVSLCTRSTLSANIINIIRVKGKIIQNDGD